MKKMGRKSLKEELQIKQRYADLSDAYFRVLSKALESGVGQDEKWAVEQLTKAYTKMIPQEVTGADGKDLFPTPLLDNLNVHNHEGDAESSGADKANKSSPGGNFGEQDGIDTLIPD
jgi:hypothetical protein